MNFCDILKEINEFRGIIHIIAITDKTLSLEFTPAQSMHTVAV